MVSLDSDRELESAEASVKLDVDCLLGGTRAREVIEIIRANPIRYFPFPGQIVGHPSELQGTLEDIVESARSLAALDRVHGLDLLAYSCLLYTSPSPRDAHESRMPSSA